jgi:hypothetical protein
MSQLGLKQGDGCMVTQCCGIPVAAPAESGSKYNEDADASSSTSETSSPQYCITTRLGNDLTRDNFPDADFVCPECERTWPASCSHESITLTTPSNPHVTGHERSMTALCDDCGDELVVDVAIVDARKRE